MTTPLDRRAFLRNAGFLTAGVIAADQLELVERIGWTRRLFPTFSKQAPILWGDGIHDDTVALNALFAGERIVDRTAHRAVNVSPQSIRLTGGAFRVTDSVHLNVERRQIQIGGSYFDGSSLGVRPLFVASEMPVMSNNRFIASFGVRAPRHVELDPLDVVDPKPHWTLFAQRLDPVAIPSIEHYRGAER